MSAEFEAQILADLRRTHAQLKAGRTMMTSAPAWSMRLTIEEVDLLLKIVDERDDLKRRLLSDWEPDLGDAQMVTAAPASCPFADTIHDCPRGGCPDASPREVQIPDLPMDVIRELPGEAVAALVGREAREMPPESPSARGNFVGNFFHVWPCPLFYRGNWNGEKPAQRCVGGKCPGTPA